MGWSLERHLQQCLFTQVAVLLSARHLILKKGKPHGTYAASCCPELPILKLILGAAVSIEYHHRTFPLEIPHAT